MAGTNPKIPVIKTCWLCGGPVVELGVVNGAPTYHCEPCNADISLCVEFELCVPGVQDVPK